MFCFLSSCDKNIGSAAENDCVLHHVDKLRQEIDVILSHYEGLFTFVASFILKVY
jgi:hypothetical protein